MQYSIETCPDTTSIFEAGQELVFVDSVPFMEKSKHHDAELYTTLCQTQATPRNWNKLAECSNRTYDKLFLRLSSLPWQTAAVTNDLFFESGSRSSRERVKLSLEREYAQDSMLSDIHLAKTLSCTRRAIPRTS